jgi:hypothetical protein
MYNEISQLSNVCLNVTRDSIKRIIERRLTFDYDLKEYFKASIQDKYPQAKEINHNSFR